MKIEDRLIDIHHPPYVVAEIGTSGGNLQLAKDSIIAARDCGADAVKIQCYEADEMAYNGGLMVEDGPWKGQRLYDLYKENEIDPNDVKELFSFARQHRVTLFASIFSPKGVDLMVELDAPAIKIASFELTDTPLITYAASKNLPMIISTGMGIGQEIINAIHAYNKGSPDGVGRNLGLLHCISNYPTDPRDANLPALGTLSALVGGRHVVGFSDHTLGFGSAISAIGYGASIIEKHFILDRSLNTADSGFSFEPAEFKLLVKDIREAWQAIQPRRGCSPRPEMAKYRRSIWAVKPISAGDVFDEGNCRILRGGNGVAPSQWSSVLGAHALQAIPAGTPLSKDAVSSLSQNKDCSQDRQLSS